MSQIQVYFLKLQVPVSSRKFAAQTAIAEWEPLFMKSVAIKRTVCKFTKLFLGVPRKRNQIPLASATT